MLQAILCTLLPIWACMKIETEKRKNIEKRFETFSPLAFCKIKVKIQDILLENVQPDQVPDEGGGVVL